jgi:hypothetical protein
MDPCILVEEGNESIICLEGQDRQVLYTSRPF